MADFTPILNGARFKIRDLWPASLRYLVAHLTPWEDNGRRLRVGIRASAGLSAFCWPVYRTDEWRCMVRIHAGHATTVNAFAPGLDVSLGPFDGPEAARDAADAALLAWFAARIDDRSVIYPWPPVDTQRPLFGGTDG